jgi:hypothetical protein
MGPCQRSHSFRLGRTTRIVHRAAAIANSPFQGPMGRRTQAAIAQAALVGHLQAGSSVGPQQPQGAPAPKTNMHDTSHEVQGRGHQPARDAQPVQRARETTPNRARFTTHLTKAVPRIGNCASLAVAWIADSWMEPRKGFRTAVGRVKTQLQT